MINFKVTGSLVTFYDDKGNYDYKVVPTAANVKRFDFISRDWNYHYNYKGIVSRGFLIKVDGHKVEDKQVGYNTYTRLYRV